MMDQTSGRKTGLPPIIDKRSRTLILGSLPGDESLRLGQYYAKSSNQFWPILGNVFAEEILRSSYAEKCAFLCRNRIAVWDVLQSARREGSQDTNIRDGLLNDIASLLIEYDAIEAVGFNGAKAMELFRRHNGDLLESFRERNIRYRRLPSSSSLNTRMTKGEKSLIWKQFIKPSVGRPHLSGSKNSD